MGAELDEQRLRKVLDAMTADQPAAPPDRGSSIRRRATRYRWNRAAGFVALLAAVAASATGIGLEASSSPAASGSRQVPSWALPWPDHRNGSVPQRVLNQAVIAWLHLASSPGTMSAIPSSSVIWYLGQTVANGQVVVVAFEADGPDGPQLVAGSATASHVMRGQPGWSADGSSPWALYFVRAPSPRRPTLAIGLNLGVVSASNLLDNLIVELTAPSMHSLVIQVPGVTRQSVSVAGTTGLLVRDVGQVTGRVLVGPQPGQPTSQIRLDNMSFVGLPGSPASEVPRLASPPALAGSYIRPSEVFEQGSLGFGFRGYLHPLPVGRAIVARCYGPAALRIAINDEHHQVGVVPCDDAQHELKFGSQRVKSIWVVTSNLTSYRLALIRG
jgi:hypothetical protein